MTHGFANFKRQEFRTDCLTISVIEGPVNGPLLVLLPGMLDLATDYDSVSSQLSSDFHVVVPDLRGHGLSEHDAAGRYSVRDYSDDIASLITQLGSNPAYVSGNSLGGLIALDLAARRKDLVAGIALEDVPLFITELPHWPHHWMYPFFSAVTECLQSWRASGGTVETLSTGIASLPLFRPRLDQGWQQRLIGCGKTIELMRANGVFDPKIRGGWERYLQQDRPTFGECFSGRVIDAIAATWATVDPIAPLHAVDHRINDGFDHSQAMADLECPVLLWEADRDLCGLLSPDQVVRLKALLSGVPSRYIEVTGAGHQIHRDAPERFVAETKDFFSNVLDNTSHTQGRSSQ